MQNTPDPTLDKFARNLDWNLLYTFMVVVQEQSMTQAAERLLVTQPAISLALKRLEENVKIKLLERAARKVTTTPAGEALFREACLIYTSVARLPVAFSEAPEDVSGKILISTLSQVVSDKLNISLGSFFAKYPKTELSISVSTTAEVIRAVELGQVTLGVSDGIIPDKLEKKLLRNEKFAIYCGNSHPLFGSEDMQLKDLRNLPFVNFTADVLGGEHMGDVTALRAMASIGQNVRGHSSNVHEVCRMIEIGLGIGFLPVHLAAPLVKDGRLWQLPPYSEHPEAEIYLIHNPATNFNAAEQIFIDHIFATDQISAPNSNSGF